MHETRKDYEPLFERGKKGELEAFEALLASESGRLFDYLMRMNGQISRSYEIMQESLSGISHIADHKEDVQDLLVLLYKTARSFSIEIWNADTSKLENSAYFSNAGSQIDSKTAIQLVELEKVLRSLPAKQRETLLLKARYGFAEEDIVAITGYSVDDVQEFLSQSMSVLEAATDHNTAKILKLIEQLLFFPIPEHGDQGTQNLSLVVRDLKKSSKSVRIGLIRVIGGLFLIIVVTFIVLNYRSISEYLQAILEL
jgi:DNA-directed RNA polymerase specialized sigma24 family protein